MRQVCAGHYFAAEHRCRSRTFSFLGFLFPLSLTLRLSLSLSLSLSLFLFFSPSFPLMSFLHAPTFKTCWTRRCRQEDRRWAFEYAPGMRQPINPAARTLDQRWARRHNIYEKRYAPGYAPYIYIYTIWTTIHAGMRQGMRLDNFHIKSDHNVTLY